MTVKTCTKCGQMKSADRDHFGSRGGKLRSHCRECERKAVANHTKNNPEKMRDRLEKRKERERLAGVLTKGELDRLRRHLELTQNGECYYCGDVVNGVGHIDHQEPVSRGGSNDPGNMVLACPKCNQEKHGKTLAEYRQWRRNVGLKVDF